MALTDLDSLMSDLTRKESDASVESPAKRDSFTLNGQESTAESVTPRIRKPKGTTNVIAVRLDSSGKIDSDRMRGETLKRLKEAVNKSDLIEKHDGSEPLYALLVPAIYKLAGGIEALLAVPLLKATRQDAAEVFAYTDEEIAILQQPTANVLAKYSNSFLLEHTDLLALAFHLTAIHQQKLELLAEKKKARKAKPEPPRPQVQ